MSNQKDSNTEFIGFSKENFIEFISSVGPIEINEFISSRGKPAKLIIPIIYF